VNVHNRTEQLIKQGLPFEQAISRAVDEANPHPDRDTARERGEYWDSVAYAREQYK
jgi:hypothetical protein